MPPATSNGSSGAPWIPLRDDYFETPLLSHKESAYLVRKSCEAAQEVVERARSSGGPIQWRHVEKYHDVQLYAGFSRGTYSSEPTSMCGVTSVPGSIKEIAALFDLPTTRAMKEFGRSHRDLFFDSVVLYTLSPRTREKPLHQVTAKWVATKCPKGLDDRDYCYLECQDKFMDSTGRKGWVLCLHSIKLPGCDELSREFGFVRGSFYHSGIVVVESDRPGHVDIIHMLQMNLKNNTKMPQSYLRERVAWISRLKGILRVKRLNEQRYLSDLELVPKKYRSRCNVCQDSFSLLLLRKMNCRKCGEVVCGACSKEFDVTNAKFLETIKLRICMHCYQMIATGQSSNVLEQPRASTSLSLLGYHEDNHRASIITETMPGERAGLHPHSTNREGPTKIFLQSMRHHADRRSSRRTRETEPGHRMQPRAPYPEPLSTDPGARMRRPSRHHAGDAQPASAPGGYAYDSRSLFDKPRESRGNGHGYAPMAPPQSKPVAPPPQPEDPPVPPPPASLFDRRSTRVKQDDFDMRRTEEIRSSTKQSALPTTSPRRKSRLSTRDSRGTFKIPHSLYDYSALDPDAAKPQPPSSPVRGRGNSTSSVSSTGSIDIDSYEVGKANAANGAAGTLPEGDSKAASIDQAYQDAKTLVRAYPSVDDEDTEGSVGSGDDEPEFVPHVKASAHAPRASPTYYEDEEEETKSHEFESTPALPPPSPSAFMTTQDALMASSHTDTMDTMDVPFHRRNFNISDLSSVYTTTDCDTRYLDSEMRQFHGQPFYMRDASEDRPTIDLSRGTSGSMHGGPFQDGSVLADSDATRDSESPPPDAAIKTSPMKPASMMDRPPLYGRGSKKEPSSILSNRSTESRPTSVRIQVTEASILSRDSVSTTPRFDLYNGTMVSTAPSTHSHEDLMFNDDPRSPQLKPSMPISEDASSEAGESNASEKPPTSDASKPTSRPPTVPPRRAPPPPPPAYIPSRFQSRSSETAPQEATAVVAKESVLNRESLNDEEPANQPTANGAGVLKGSVLDRESLNDDEPADEPVARPAASKREQASVKSSNQDDIDDVDFEELLRMSMSNQDDDERRHPRRQQGALQRSHTFDVANASAGHYGDLDDSSDSDDEQRDLLSARRIYRKFNSSKRLEKVAGVGKNPSVQRTFDQIQESFNLMSDSEDDSDSESVGWSEDVAALNLKMKQAVL